MQNRAKLAGKFAVICVLFVAAYLGLWWGLDRLQFSVVPPFYQPGVEEWYTYDIPPKWFALPAALIALVVWVVGSYFFPDSFFDNSDEPPETP